MFLNIAYMLFIFQIFAVIFLMLPLPSRIRTMLFDFLVRIKTNLYIRCIVTVVMLIVIGLFVENLMTTLKYSETKTSTSMIMIDSMNMNPMTIVNRNEMLIKLYRAQRNIYLTFNVIFNWIIIYRFYGFIRNEEHMRSIESINKIYQ